MEQNAAALQTITWALGIAFALSLAFNAWIAANVVALKTQMASLTEKDSSRQDSQVRMVEKMENLIEEFTRFRINNARRTDHDHES